MQGVTFIFFFKGSFPLAFLLFHGVAYGPFSKQIKVKKIQLASNSRWAKPSVTLNQISG